MPVADQTTSDNQNALNWKMFTDEMLSGVNVRMQNANAQQQRVNEVANANMQLALQSAQHVAHLTNTSALQMTLQTQMLAQAMTGRVSRHILDLSAEQAVAFSKELAADLSAKMEDFGATLSSIEQFSKIGAATPPQTGTGGAFGSDAGSPLLQQIANTQALMVNALTDLSAAIAALKKE